ELLQALPFPVVQIGDRFHVLAVQVRQQALDILPGVGLLLGRSQGLDEGSQEGVQPGQRAAQQAGPDFRIAEQFVQPNPKTTLHGSAPFSGSRPPKEAYTPMVYGRSRRETQWNY